MDDNDIMPFGKYKGAKMANVPDTYLLWLHETGCWNQEVKKYIEDNLDVLKPAFKQGNHD